MTTLGFTATNPTYPPRQMDPYLLRGGAAMASPFTIALGETVTVAFSACNCNNGDNITAALLSVAPVGALDLVAVPGGVALHGVAAGSATLFISDNMTGATAVVPVTCPG